MSRRSSSGGGATQTDPLSAQELGALPAAQMARLASLRVSSEQAYMGGSVTESLEAWTDGPRDKVLGLCFLLAESPIGLTLFKRPPLAPDWVGAGTASLHGLKIALPWQGRGLGHAAFRLALAELQRAWPEIYTLALSVDADNAAALAVYRGGGMTDSGPVHHGRHGLEHRMTLRLPRQHARRDTAREHTTKGESA